MDTMTDFTSSVSVSSSGLGDSGHALSCDSPESVILSPEVREAMDRIFPRSTSQLLQQEHLQESEVGKSNTHHDSTKNLFHNHLNISDPLPAYMSSAASIHSQSPGLTAGSTTVTVTVPSNAMTSTSGVFSSPATLSSVEHSPSHSPVCDRTYAEDKDGFTTGNDSSSQPGKMQRRISKADLEIISSKEDFINQSHERTSRRQSSQSAVGDNNAKGGSDSEDMRRPFAVVDRGKKKSKKRKKKGTDTLSGSINNEENQSSCLNGEDFHTEAKSKGMDLSESSIGNPPCSTSIHLSLKDILAKRGVSIEGSNQDQPSSMETKELGHVENGSLNQYDRCQDINVPVEDVSNTSYSSSKENVQRKKSRQKLPKSKRSHFNLTKHRSKIRNTFLPCFVVVEKLDTSLGTSIAKDTRINQNVLPLSVRLKDLSDLCRSGIISCPKRKAEKQEEELKYKNIFEETGPLDPASECEITRGRRILRKRDKYINYVEPSEDDILDDFSKNSKHGRSKRKDPPDSLEECLSAKRRKRHSDSESSSSASDYKVDQASAGEEVIVKEPEKPGSTQNTSGGLKEIIVYPPLKPKEVVGYSQADIKEKSDSKKKRASKDSPKSKQNSSVSKTSNSLAVPSTHISVLPTSTLQGLHSTALLPPFTSSVSMCPPGSFPVQSVIARPAMPDLISVAGGTQKPPQYCMVKMAGKDVLLQLVPSTSGIGMQPAGMQTVVLPGGKRLIMPTSSVVPNTPLYNHSLHQATSISSSSSLPASVTFTSALQANAVSTTPLQTSFGFPPYGTLSNPQSISLASLPVITASAIGLTGSSSTLTQTVTSTVLSIPTSQCVSSIATAATTSVSPVISRAVAVSAVRLPTSLAPALSMALAPMPAPTSTTVVRTVRVPAGPNWRAVVPNQSTPIRSVRIFVPSCSATGTPSRYATLGSIPTSSPLTHLSASSDLLPQRKTAGKELTASQILAKRKKLEKKYPLPPGVVIKTEPLDNFPSSATTSSPRSLLSQNVQLLTTGSRSATGVQSIRIISPSLANALSSRNVRGNSNVIYRASLGRGQTILVPTSLGLVATHRITNPTTTLSQSVTSAIVSTVSSPPTTSTSAAVTTTAVATRSVIQSSTSLTTVTVSPPSSSSSPAVSSSSASTAVSSSSASTAVSSSSSSGSNVTGNLSSSASTVSMLPSLLDNVSSSHTEDSTSSNPHTCTSGNVASGVQSDAVSVLSSCNSITTQVTTNSETASSSPCHISATATSFSENGASTTQLPSATEIHQVEMVPDAATLESTRLGLESFRKFVQTQEGQGLKEERLAKLKELLAKKETSFKHMQELYEQNRSSASGATQETSQASDANVDTDSSNADVQAGSESDSVVTEGTETDPFVID